ncbi:UNVERIFIED_ORG: C4-dicarboxylate ABC transporter [Bacillus sp. AZ43]
MPLTYEPSQWSIVFPLGMYAVAATYLSRADDLPLVGVVGEVGVWVAFTVWATVLVAMLLSVYREATAREGAVSGRSDVSTY